MAEKVEKNDLKTKNIDKKEIKDNKNNKKTGYDLFKFDNILKLLKSEKNINTIQIHLISHIKSIIKKYKFDNDLILFIYSPNESINEFTADSIYRAIPIGEKKNILMIIHSSGGSVEPAYLISKCCKEYAKKFVIVIPRKAKSAATLISLGADEIHMGIMSELGPIDPQIDLLPALGLINAVEYLASLCKTYPEAGDMFAKYLSAKLDLRVLGYFNRVTESAAQYAERLLSGKELPSNYKYKDIARQFVYTYKDHNFVIDSKEAQKFLGKHVKTNSKEYLLGNEIHNFINILNILLNIFNFAKSISIIGDLEKGFRFINSDKK